MRDYATIEQLLVLANLENINALFIEQSMSQMERMSALHSIAKSQLEAIVNTKSLINLKILSDKNKAITDKQEI